MSRCGDAPEVMMARCPAKVSAQVPCRIIAVSVLMPSFHLHDFHYVVTGTGFIVISPFGVGQVWPEIT